MIPTFFDQPVTQQQVDTLAQIRLAFDGLIRNLKHIVTNTPQDPIQQIENALEVARRTLNQEAGEAPSPEQVEAEHLRLNPGVRNPDYAQWLVDVCPEVVGVDGWEQT